MTDYRMKAAVIFYSRTNHSRRLADEIARKLDADVFEILVNRYRWPIVGYLRAGFESLIESHPKLRQPIPKLNSYDVLVFGGPVWTSYPATPLRSFLESVGPLTAKLGLFFTNGADTSPDKAFELAEIDFGRPFDAQVAIGNDLEASVEADDRINDFLEALLSDVAVADRIRVV